jgi:RNase P subunit RPR2
MKSMQSRWQLRVKLDYMHVVCGECDTVAQVQYLRKDPAMPKVQFACSTCGNTEAWKIDCAQGFRAKAI